MIRRRRTLLAAAAMVGTVMVVRWAVLEPLTVLSPSMEPTLSVGSTLLVDRLTGRWRPVDRDDLIVFASPDDGGDAVKRVVAIEGQTVALRDAVLHVDGVEVDEPQVDLSRIDGTWFGPVTVPDGAVFVLGDSRGLSIDSRTYGSIPLNAVIGRVVAVLPAVP